jgi:hypothetical protein
MDGGALSIKGNILRGVESYCQLTQPTQVRDMDGVLYDALCAAEGEEYIYRVMLLRNRQGVFVISDGEVSDWRRCK